MLDSLVEKLNDEKFQKDVLIPITDAIVDRQFARMASRVGGWNKTGSAERQLGGIDLKKLAKGKIGLGDIIELFAGFKKEGGEQGGKLP